MKIKFFTVFVYLYVITVFSQKLEYKKYNWEDKFNISNYELDEKQSVIVFKDHSQKEFYFENKSFYQNKLIHKILWLNSDESIENNNKVYLPYDASSELLLSKARVVTADGKITEVPKDKILTAKDEETKKNYKYYALEGIEKGCFIEFFYVVKSYASYKGTKVTLQSNSLKKNVSFEVFAPKNLIFDFFENGVAKVIKDTVFKDKNRWFMKEASIEALNYEQMAPLEALKKHIVFKLDQNLYDAGNGISSYDVFARDVFELYYSELEKKDKREVDKIIKKLNLKSLETEEAVRALENFLKTTFYIHKKGGIKPIKEIVSTKTANKYEILKIFIQVCEALDIKNELVLTCDRYNLKFQKKYEAYSYLDDFLLYFPKLKKYTTPSSIGDRLGFPFYNYTGNYGLFIKKIKVNDFSTAVPKIKYIKPTSAEDSKDVMDVVVEFKDEFSETNINLKRTLSGYKACYYQPYLHLLTPEKYEKVLEEIIKIYGEDVEVNNVTAENNDSKLYGVKPFIIKGDLKFNGFLNKAGNKYVFNVGGLLGPQQEMYQLTKRTLPFENQFNRTYQRQIVVKIPEGYTVKNLEKLKMDVKSEKDGKVVHAFVSNYENNNNEIKITINEYYKDLFIEVDKFESFRKVINAAADFNKIELIFVKQN